MPMSLAMISTRSFCHTPTHLHTAIEHAESDAIPQPRRVFQKQILLSAKHLSNPTYRIYQGYGQHARSSQAAINTKACWVLQQSASTSQQLQAHEQPKVHCRKHVKVHLQSHARMALTNQAQGFATSSNKYMLASRYQTHEETQTLTSMLCPSRFQSPELASPCLH